MPDAIVCVIPRPGKVDPSDCGSYSRISVHGEVGVVTPWIAQIVNARSVNVIVKFAFEFDGAMCRSSPPSTYSVSLTTVANTLSGYASKVWSPTSNLIVGHTVNVHE